MKQYFVIALLVHLAASQDPTLFCVDQDTCCQGLPNLASLGNWDNCTIFYVCLNESPALNHCGSERPNYNPETSNCVADVDGCISGTREPIAPPTSSTQMTTIQSTVSVTTTTPTTTTSPGNGNCTEDGAYFVPYPGDCRKYMICSNFILLPDVQECPSGTLFDPDLKECNLESLVECKPTCPDSETIRLPHDKNCSLYWLCSMGIANLRQCPPGLLFDPVLEACNLEDQVFCPNLCPLEGTVNLPHARNCSLYWLCTLGDPTLKQCLPELLFDPVRGQCNLASEVDCDHIGSHLEYDEIDNDEWSDDFSDEDPKQW